MTRTLHRLLVTFLCALLVTGGTLAVTAQPASAADIGGISVMSTDASTVFGESVTFVVTVTATTAPTGTVDVLDGSTTICSEVDLNVDSATASSATCMTSALSVGSHSITALYNGDGTYVPATSSAISQVVSDAPTTTSLMSSANPSGFGQAVTFTASVTPDTGTSTPEGDVAFTSDGVDITDCSAKALVAGSTTCTTSELGGGDRTITAVYSPDPNFVTSTSSDLVQAVTTAATTTGLTSAPSPSGLAESVTFTATVTSTAGTPTGLVAFKVGGTDITGCAAKSLSLGVTTCATTELTVGSQTITAVYAGTDDYATSTSADYFQTVNQAATSTALDSSTNPSVFSESVVFTATVTPTSPATGTPTGTVAFTDGGTLIVGCETRALAGGVATCTTPAFAVGDHDVVAAYAGSVDYAVSESEPTSQTVSQAATSTVVTTNDNATTYSEPVTFTATISPTSPATEIPGAGTVAFRVNGTAITTCSAQPVSTGVATCTTSTTPVGSPSITAVYSGDTSYLTSTSPGITQSVVKADTSTVLTSSNTAAVFSEPITFTATVSPTAPATTAPSSGTMNFFGGSVSGCSARPVTNGVATCETDELPVGEHLVASIYSGAPSYTASISSLVTQTVGTAATTTVVTSADASTTWTESVTFTATVSPAAPATATPTDGTVSFTDGLTAIEGCTARTIDGGAATCTTTALSIGAHSIAASYSGDDDFDPSDSATITQTVDQASSTTVVTSSDSTTSWRTPVTFTATVSPVAPATTTPTGAVSFAIDGTPIGTCATQPLDGAGVATCLTDVVPVGANPITAVYAGDPSYDPSTSLAITQTVSPADSATALTTSIAETVWGQSTTFTAAVTPVAPATATPTGAVSFDNDGTPITGCEARPLDHAGVATCATNAVPVGANPITAVYAGDLDYATSTSLEVLQTVNKAVTSATLTSDTNPSVFGSAVTFTAEVLAVAPGAGTPDGFVAFQADGIDIAGCASRPLTAGLATCVTAALTQGTSEVTAVYATTDQFLAITSPAVTQSVTQAGSTTVVTTTDATTIYSEPVTFTATISPVAPAVATPSGGTVNFNLFGASLGTCNAMPVTNGVATCTTTAVPVGDQLLAAAYSGTAGVGASLSPFINQTVTQSATSTLVTSSAPTSTQGDAVTFTATVAPVAPATATPSTGTVTFNVGGDPVTSCTETSVSVGVATCMLSDLPIGVASITATYSGDANRTASTSPAVTHTVNPAFSSTVVSSSDLTTVWGESVTFTATVSPSAPATATPTGTATFNVGGVPITACTALALVAGVATCAMVDLPVGPTVISAVYGGSAAFQASTSPDVTQTVAQAATATALTSATNPSTFSSPVTFTASVSTTAPGNGVPTGTVAFKAGGVDISGCASKPLTSGVATCAAGALPAGSSSITAVYAATASSLTSTSAPVTQVVAKAATSTVVTSSGLTGTWNQPVTFTATISPTAATGTVMFKTGAATITGCATRPVATGTATCTTSALAAGSSSITAVYSGDASYLTSTSPAITQRVLIPSLTLMKASTQAPRFGQAVAIKMTVSSTGGGTGTPTGLIKLFRVRPGLARLQIGQANLVNGVVTITVSNTPVGSHKIVAEYKGSVLHAESQRSLTLVVSP